MKDLYSIVTFYLSTTGGPELMLSRLDLAQGP